MLIVLIGTCRAVYALFFKVRKWALFAPSVCDFIFELPCTSEESYPRLYVKIRKHFTYFVLNGDHTYHVPGTGTRYLYTVARSSSQQVPRSCCCTKRVTPLESSHGHHLPTRAASARAAHGRCFDPKRAATAPGCRVCSASPEHRVGSINSRAGSNSGSQGSQQQQYEGLVDNS